MVVTVDELINYLQQYDADVPVVLYDSDKAPDGAICMEYVFTAVFREGPQ